MHRDLSAIFKAYDIRGTYPGEIDEDAARRIGAALAHFCDASRLAVGRDMRTSSEALARAFARGASSVGAEVLDLGLVSSDGLYFASGKLDVPACMVTASHNPARYNGFKPCRAGAAPIGSESGLKDIQALAEEDEGAAEVSDHQDSEVAQLDIIGDYSAHCRSFVKVEALRPLKVVIDAGNGMAGLTVPVVFEDLPFQLVPLYFELDGTFPNHPASPIEPENLVDLQRAVQETGSDLGIAFDGDADRMFLVDERSNPVSGSTTTALVAERVLKKQPGERIIYNLICSWTVPEIIRENGGEPIRTRVGHSFIKDVMAKTGAAFGGEHSGHYYFRDNFRADSGMIAALLVLEALSLADKPLSELLEPYNRYFASGEINSEVKDQQERLEVLADGYQEGKQDRTDGLTVELEDWWFNCRPSNTEPLLRLNLEARTEELMKTKRNEVLSLIRENGEG